MSNKIQEKYLKDMVYGSIDGIITTFAVVSGVMGAGFSYAVIIVLGIANLIADGISMAASNYASNKSEIEKINNKRLEYREKIKSDPNLQAKELKDILCKEGFEEESAKAIQKEIVTDKSLWERVLIDREFGKFENIEPRKTAFATFSAFVVAGLIPLLAFLAQFIWPGIEPYAFHASIALSGVALFLVGILKGKIVKKSVLRSGAETLIIGGAAALVAFLIGLLLGSLVV